jgi:opacity protein-like surface antigen
MGAQKALFLAGALCVGSATTVFAADLLPPPPPLDPGVVVVAESDGWYLRGDAGVGMTVVNGMRSTFTLNVPDPRWDSKSISDTAFVRVGLGYQFNNWFRADLTGEYRIGSHIQGVQSFNQGFFFTPATADRSYDNYSGNIAHAVLMANGYVDLGTWNRITPYLGVGLGYAYHFVSGLHDYGGVSSFAPGQFGISGLGYAPSRTTGSFAWAVMAGLGYNVNEHLKLDIGYRYLDLGTAKSAAIVCQTQPVATCPFEGHNYKLASHDISIGMRWMFGASTSTQATFQTAGAASCCAAAYPAAAGGSMYGSGAYAAGASSTYVAPAAPVQRRAAPRKRVVAAAPKLQPLPSVEAQF